MWFVADTNAAVSAFLWGGAPTEVLNAARHQTITLYSNAALFAARSTQFQNV